MISTLIIQIAFSKVVDTLENHNDEQEDIIIGMLYAMFNIILDDIKILKVGYAIDGHREHVLDNSRNPQVTDESSSLGLV